MVPYSPEGIAARTEILDKIYLYSHAVDRRHWKLMEQVFHDDAVCDVAIFRGPWRTFIADAAKAMEAALSYTSHQLGNFLMSFEGESIAHTETYCTAYHRIRADAPPAHTFGGTGEAYDLVGGLRYIDRFEKRDGRWAITERRGLGEWHQLLPYRKDAMPSLPEGFSGAFGPDATMGPIVAYWTAETDTDIQ